MLRDLGMIDCIASGTLVCDNTVHVGEMKGEIHFLLRQKSTLFVQVLGLISLD